MNTPQDMGAWRVAAAGVPSVYIHNYRMLGAELKGWELVNVAEMADSPGAVEHVYLWARKGFDGKALLRVSISEFGDVGSALLGLQGVLANSMNPEVPPAPKALVPAAGVAFAAGAGAGAGAGAIKGAPKGDQGKKAELHAAWLQLGNLTLRIDSVGDEPADVAPLVKLLATRFTKPPSSAALAGAQASEIKPGARARAAVAGDAAPLIENLAQHAQRNRWVQVLAPTGELRREGDAVLYAGPAAGRHAARSFVIGPN